MLQLLIPLGFKCNWHRDYTCALLGARMDTVQFRNVWFIETKLQVIDSIGILLCISACCVLVVGSTSGRTTSAGHRGLLSEEVTVWFTSSTHYSELEPVVYVLSDGEVRQPKIYSNQPNCSDTAYSSSAYASNIAGTFHGLSPMVSRVATADI